MTREVWPLPEIEKASRDVVCLAVYRWRHDDYAPTPSSKPAKKGGVEDSDWAIRLNVKAYPQTRLLDGWGRPLPSSDANSQARDAKGVVAAMAAAERDGKKARKPDAPKLPAALLKRVSDEDRAKVTDAIAVVRAKAWLRILGKGKWSQAEVVSLLRADDDALLRLRLLQRLGEEKALEEATADAVAEMVEGENDYVRGESLRLLGATGGKRAVATLKATIAKALDGRSGWKNPNNVLCEATEAAISCPDKELVAPLGRVFDLHGANNYATVLAAKALVAIGKKEGKDLVRAPLEKARKLEGPNAATIRKEVESLLGK